MYNHKFIVVLTNVDTNMTRVVTIITIKECIDSHDIPDYILLETYTVAKVY